MAQGFYGADPDQLRALAKQFSSGSNQIRSSLDTVSSLVNSTQSWHGPDASAFQQRWNAQVKQLGNTVVHALEQGSTTLIKNADEQTATSQVDGGASGHGPGAPGQPGGPGGSRSPGDSGFTFMDGWDKYSKLTNSLDLVKGGYGSIWLLAHDRNIFNQLEWKRLPGRSAPYNLMDSASDFLGLDNLKKYFPSLNITQDVLNSSTGLARAKNGVLGFIGDGGLGKGIGLLGVGIDAFDMGTKIAEGDAGGAAWSGTKAALGAASFLPPPAGTVAQVASLGIFAYENIPAVKEFVDSGAKAVTDTVSNAVKESGKFVNDVGDNLKNAGEGVKNFLGL